MPNTLRERFDEKFWDWTLWFDEIVEFLEQEISLARQEALKEWEEKWEKIGIAKCINLIPEQKAIVPLWGDNKYYAWYNAGIQLTRDNFDKYFNSL